MTHDDNTPRTPAEEAADNTLDAAVRGARRGPSAEDTRAAQQRAWSRIVEESAAHPAHGCDAIIGELPELVAGSLSAARAELLADHCRECVTCRRELLRLRDAGHDAPMAPPVPTGRRWMRLVAPLAVAATVALGALVTFKVLRDSGHDAPLRIARLDGQILLASDGLTALAEGATVPPGQAVRTTKGSRAVLELPDGSRVEMNERAELSFSQTGEAMTVDLERGDIIFEAAKRHERNLFVKTDDCTVAVKGTVFTVGHGLKGSRVGVLEGEVHVDQGRDRRVLHPGDQATTNPELGDEPLAEQVSWSLESSQWATLAAEIDRAAAQLDAENIPPAVRHESKILDAMPAQTVFYTAMPNGGSVARFMELVSERVAANPELAAWWSKEEARSKGGEPSIPELLSRLSDLASSVGDEVVLALIIPPGQVGMEPMPIVAAAVPDEAQLRQAIAALPWGEGEAPRFSTLADVEKSALAGTDDFMLVLHAGHVLAGPASSAFLQVAAGLEHPALSATPFLDSLHAQYSKGAEFLLAADLASMVDRTMAQHAARAADDGADPLARFMSTVGLDGVERFVVTAGSQDEGSAALTFRDARSGMASWLAEPGPMGSLDFVRPEATFVTAALFRDPGVMLADLETRLGDSGLTEEIETFRKETGVDLFQDVAGPMGGEMAFAIDGPLLPMPSWKLIIEVYDQPRFDVAIDRLVARAGEWAAEEAARSGMPARVFTVAEETLKAGPARVLELGGMEIHYAYRDGYLVACPSRPLLESALQAHEAGSLAESAKLASLLPAGSDHVSLLSYQDFGQALGDLAKAIPSSAGIPAEAQALASAGPMLVHARASDRAIVLGLGSNEGGASGHLASILRQAMVQSLAHRAALSAVGYDGRTAPPATTAPAAQ